ncbi:MAG: PrgI family protein [Eubacterium sp.]|nr:PrgI family protein [Eubacterium sp.]MBQ7201763.1 PrgI family protein [Eubacterium sp.]
MTKQINQDVAGFKDDFFKGLSARECVYGAAALLVGVGGIVTMVFYYEVQMNIAITVCMPFIVAIGLCGFYEKNGMTLPQIIKSIVRLIRQKPLTYQTCHKEDRQSNYLIERELVDHRSTPQKGRKHGKKQHTTG